MEKSAFVNCVPAKEEKKKKGLLGVRLNNTDQGRGSRSLACCLLWFSISFHTFQRMYRVKHIIVILIFFFL